MMVEKKNEQNKTKTKEPLAQELILWAKIRHACSQFTSVDKIDRV